MADIDLDRLESYIERDKDAIGCVGLDYTEARELLRRARELERWKPVIEAARLWSSSWNASIVREAHCRRSLLDAVTAALRQEPTT